MKPETLLRPLFNRTADGGFVMPEDGFFHLVPTGQFHHPPSNTMQVLDRAALESIVNRFREESRQTNFPGLLIDFDHQSYDTGRSSEAAGWITDLQNRSDGLWGRVRWSDLGEAALRNGRFRFISPVWLRGDVEWLANDRIRPLRLDTAGLTNSPNLRGMSPLSNRQAAGADSTENQKHKPKEAMKNIATRLGLTAEASEEAVLAEITKLQNRAETSEKENAPLKNRVTELEGQNQTLLTSQVESDLERFKNRYKEEDREKIKNRLLKDREGAIEILEAMPETKPVAGASASQPIHNRAGAKVPNLGATAGVGSESIERQREVEAYRNSKGCDFETAWNAVRRMKPELFAN